MKKYFLPVIFLLACSCDAPAVTAYKSPGTLPSDRWCYERDQGWFSPAPDHVIDVKPWVLVLYTAKRGGTGISLLSYHGGICKQEDWKPNEPIAKYAGEKAAIELKKGLYKLSVDKFGAAQFKKNILAPSPYSARIYPEDRAALKSFGIELPAKLPDPEAEREKEIQKARKIYRERGGE